MSASSRPTRRPSMARARARLVATVDLPTPPLPLATATMRRMPGTRFCCAQGLGGPAAAGALGWVLAEWRRSGKPSVLGGISGCVAGLVAITPASGFVKPFPALLIGFLAGIVCYFMVAKVKQKLGYDDSLDAFGVHGCGGTLGAVLTGVFATSAVNDGFKRPLGLVDGHPGQVWNQAAGCAIAWSLAIVGTLAVLKICDAVIGLRVSESQEVAGLDLSMHGEEGYILEA